MDLVFLSMSYISLKSRGASKGKMGEKYCSLKKCFDQINPGTVTSDFST